MSARQEDRIDYSKLSPEDSTFFRYMDDLNIRPDTATGRFMRNQYLEAGSPFIDTSLPTGERAYYKTATHDISFPSPFGDIPIYVKNFSAPDTMRIQSPVISMAGGEQRMKRGIPYYTPTTEEMERDMRYASMHDYMAELAHGERFHNYEQVHPIYRHLMQAKSSAERGLDDMLKLVGLNRGESRYKSFGLPYRVTEEDRTHNITQRNLERNLFNLMQKDPQIMHQEYFPYNRHYGDLIRKEHKH